MISSTSFTVSKAGQWTNSSTWATIILLKPYLSGPPASGPFFLPTHSSSHLPASLVAAEVPIHG
jgi:hypothetical protein